MAYNAQNCSGSNFQNTGTPACKNDLQAMRMLVITKEDFEFASEADANDLTVWQTAIQAKNIFPLPQIHTLEDLSEDAIYEAGPMGDESKIRDGKRKYKALHDVPLCTHQNLRSFINGGIRIIDIDLSKNVNGYTPDGAIFKGRTVDLVDVQKMTGSDGSTTRKSPVYISEENPSDWDDNGATFKPLQAATPWNPLTALKGLKDLALTVSATATVITVTVLGECDNVEIEGLVEGDFAFLEVGGTPIVGTFAEVADGVYTFTGTGYTTGTVGLVDPSLMTTESYDGGTATSFTVV